MLFSVAQPCLYRTLAVSDASSAELDECRSRAIPTMSE